MIFFLFMSFVNLESVADIITFYHIRHLRICLNV